MKKKNHSKTTSADLSYISQKFEFQSKHEQFKHSSPLRS